MFTPGGKISGVKRWNSYRIELHLVRPRTICFDNQIQTKLRDKSCSIEFDWFLVRFCSIRHPGVGGAK